MRYSTYDFQRKQKEFLDQVDRGEEVIIVRRGRCYKIVPDGMVPIYNPITKQYVKPPKTHVSDIDDF